MNLPMFDDLLNIAEIASVFLGFTVLVTALNPSRVDMVRIMGVVIGSSLTIVLCLLPILLRTYSDDIGFVVRVSSAVWIVLNLSATVAMARLIPGFSEVQREDKIGAAIVWLLEGTMYLTLILSALLIWPHLSVAFYFAAVFALVLQVIYFFINLTLSISNSESTTSNSEA